ncbi:hypothetical protein Acr_00g0004290 [Actinidia rufa]|uniref:Uncharacterized protein n=1 Tax=Actinidia rufa TaxID=165716 RepID=A0A7J0D7E0_9ERIC|nr:hypothetical protein Acr_00g0004290 [Actinidia rufa]
MESRYDLFTHREVTKQGAKPEGVQFQDLQQLPNQKKEIGIEAPEAEGEEQRGFKQSKEQSVAAQLASHPSYTVLFFRKNKRNLTSVLKFQSFQWASEFPSYLSKSKLPSKVISYSQAKGKNKQRNGRRAPIHFFSNGEEGESNKSRRFASSALAAPSASKLCWLGHFHCVLFGHFDREGFQTSPIRLRFIQGLLTVILPKKGSGARKIGSFASSWRINATASPLGFPSFSGTRSLSLPNKPGLSGIPPLNQNSKAKGESLDRVYSLASPSSTESSIAINPVFLAVIASDSPSYVLMNKVSLTKESSCIEVAEFCNEGDEGDLAEYSGVGDQAGSLDHMEWFPDVNLEDKLAAREIQERRRRRPGQSTNITQLPPADPISVCFSSSVNRRESKMTHNVTPAAQHRRLTANQHRRMFQLLGSWAGLGKRYSFEILLSSVESGPETLYVVLQFHGVPSRRPKRRSKQKMKSLRAPLANRGANILKLQETDGTELES